MREFGNGFSVRNGGLQPTARKPTHNHMREFGNGFSVRNWGLQPTARKPTHNHMREFGNGFSCPSQALKNYHHGWRPDWALRKHPEPGPSDKSLLSQSWETGWGNLCLRLPRWPHLCFYLGFPHSSVGKESACNAGDPSSITGWGRSPGEGIGYPLQYSWASLVAQLVKNLP